ncbi:DNA-binding protein [Mesorhizobium sp. B2-6-5]|uniref:DNA-binding protein n=1 Tax=Mesorhizobium sp. B2-6-5 TaxID=2589912 RepID=UPI0011286CC3|nr:DNA-binding protein [Mesorhizobium sp. B2-6-5]TPJ34252.1 DNA-binding protein [Mesorhizobium sp. B2-6-5]
MQEDKQPPLSLIWGSAAIAAELGVTQRQCFYMLETGKLPARKIGERWVADRAALHALFRNGEAA